MSVVNVSLGTNDGNLILSYGYDVSSCVNVGHAVLAIYKEGESLTIGTPEACVVLFQEDEEGAPSHELQRIYEDVRSCLRSGENFELELNFLPEHIGFDVTGGLHCPPVLLFKELVAENGRVERERDRQDSE